MADNENVVYIGIDPNNGLDSFIKTVEATFGCTISFNQLFGVKSEVEEVEEEFSEIKDLQLKTGGAFKCSLCDKSYSSLKNLERHRSEKHGNNVYHQCQFCPYKASWPSGLKRHVQLIHEKESCPTHQCSDCSFSTKYKQSLKEHIQSFHLNQDSCNKECLECNRTFISKRGYTQHMKAYHVKGYKRKNSAGRPKVGDDENQIHTCSECDYTTHIKSYLMRHFQTVHGDVSCICDECGSEFRTKKQLKCHYRDKHSGVSFSCDLCTFKSPRYREVLRHKVRVHDKSSPDYTCEFCGFSTKYKQTLQDHMQSVHENQTFSCDNCVYTSKNKRSLVKHSRKCSGRSFSCIMCQDTFVTEKLHRVHMRKVHGQFESFKCDNCDYVTIKKGNLVKHQVSIHGYVVKTRKYKKRSENRNTGGSGAIQSRLEEGIKEDMSSLQENSPSHIVSTCSRSSPEVPGPFSYFPQPWPGFQNKISPRSSPDHVSRQGINDSDYIGRVPEHFSHPAFPWHGLHIKSYPSDSLN